MQLRKRWQPLTLITKAEQLRRRLIKIKEIHQRILEKKKRGKDEE